MLGERRYLDAASKASSFIEASMFKNGSLVRRYRDGSAGIEALLDDYAFLIQGLLDLYEAGFDPHQLELATKLQSHQDELLWRENRRGYAVSSGTDKTVTEERVTFEDGAEPSGNGVSALNLLRLHLFTGDPARQKRAGQIISQGLGGREIHPLAHATLLSALDLYRGPAPEIAVAGAGPADAEPLRTELAKRFIPNRVLAAGPPAKLGQGGALTLLEGKQLREGKTTYYICENHTCREPVTDLKRALEIIGEVLKPQVKNAAP